MGTADGMGLMVKGEGKGEMAASVGVHGSIIGSAAAVAWGSEMGSKALFRGPARALAPFLLGPLGPARLRAGSVRRPPGPVAGATPDADLGRGGMCRGVSGSVTLGTQLTGRPTSEVALRGFAPVLFTRDRRVPFLGTAAGRVCWDRFWILAPSPYLSYKLCRVGTWCSPMMGRSPLTRVRDGLPTASASGARRMGMLPPTMLCVVKVIMELFSDRPYADTARTETR
mmetsp:Transcript_49348/g.88134  ORF Transcript_49348/g.88134 Transcript_49348/m.88134 type:complete len:227 (-) Transcript_49348:1427-2107(-)